jgi:DNA-binding IclR family transcriptional regulator
MARQRPKALPNKTDNDLGWVVKAVDLIKEVAANADDNKIDLDNYTAATGLDRETAEQRLRKLGQLGWVSMDAERAIDGTFVRFVWTLR